MMDDRLRRWKDLLPGRRGAMTAGAGAATLAVGAGLIWRALAGSRPDGPSAAAVASETAISVADAAKATVLERIEQAEECTHETIEEAAAAAVREAAWAGADVVAAAMGAVEAAQEARAPGLGARERTDAARRGAIAEAARIGPPAERRMRQALGS